MTELLMIGDLHGKWESYRRLLEENETTKYPDVSIQVGDFCIGYPDETEHLRNARDSVFSWGDNRFIRGNHDNVTACRQFKNFITDGTYDAELDLFSCGGALSINAPSLIEDVTWWADEELTINELNLVVDAYIKTKPRIMVSHDMPGEVIGQMFPWANNQKWRSRTRDALQAMFDVHKPEFWFCGHWHNYMEKTINGTKMICLGELDAYGLTI